MAIQALFESIDAQDIGQERIGSQHISHRARSTVGYLDRSDASKTVDVTTIVVSAKTILRCKYEMDQ